MKNHVLLGMCILVIGAAITSQYDLQAWPPSGTCYQSTTDMWESVSTCNTNADCIAYDGVTDTCCVFQFTGTKDCDLGSAQRPVFIITHPTGNCGTPCWDYWGGGDNFCKGGDDQTDRGFRATASRDSLGGSCT